MNLNDLPDEVRELIQPHMTDNTVTLDTIGQMIAGKRNEAKAARTSSGIEQLWKDCEEAYIGIDDANRGEFTAGVWEKPTSLTGPVSTSKAAANTDHKSTVFIRLTSRYVDAGSAKLGEILLPADDKAFSFSETPVPELVKAKADLSQVVHSKLGVPLTRPAQPGEAPAAPAPTAAPPPAAAMAQMPMGGQPPASAPPQVPLTVKDLALENIEIAHKAAKAAETRIYDWMVDCQYAAEMRKVICDSARIGVGVLKGPVPKSSRGIAVEKSKDGGVEIIVKETVAPSATWVDPWNIYPDPACGESIHDGDYVFERDFMSVRQVRNLKKLPGYIAAQIDNVLEEGPEKSNQDGSGSSDKVSEQKGRFTVWYFYGTISRDDMQAINAAAGKPSDAGDKEDVYAIVTLINDSVVRAVINPLDSGSFPYHSVPWQRRSQHWAGVGVAEQVRAPQKMLNAATRAMLNNAGKSAGSQIVVDRGGIQPADGVWTVTPDKIWFKSVDAAGQDVRQAFMLVEIPNVTAPIMTIINYALQLAEESTSIPLITQGQSGPTTPDTLGAANLQNNNANQLLRSIGYAFDDYITEPVVRQFYEWLLLDPDVPDEEKGDFTINAHGSVAMVERAIQDQSIAQMGNLVLNPAYGVDPKKWMQLFLKSKRLDADDVQYTEEEQAKIASAPPPEAPAVTVAKIQADTAMKELAATQTAAQQSVQNEAQIAQAAHALEGAKVQNDAQRVQVESTVKLHQLQMQHDLALLDYANKNQMSLADAKVQLAKTAMQLQTEKELNQVNNAAADVKHRREIRQRGMPKPPVQAPGRAANGQAFSQA